MAIINLLPPDLTPKKSILKLANIFTKVSYTFVAILLVLIITIAGIFIINSTKLKKLEAEKTVLTQSIKEHEQTEQQVFLAKDRMAKIKEIWKVNSVSNSIEAFKKVLLLTDSNISIRSSDFSSSKSEITLEATSADSVSKFMGSLVTSDIYGSIILKNFSFNPNFGYRISIEASIK